MDISVEQRGDCIIVRGIKDNLIYLSQGAIFLSLTEKDAAILSALLEAVVKDKAWK